MKFSRIILVYTVSFLFFTSCAKMEYDSNYAQFGSSITVTHFLSSQDENEFFESENYGQFPTTYNNEVAKWINYFVEGSGRTTMKKNIERSSRYQKYMQNIFRKEDLPPELFYMVMVESGFKSRAMSHKRAAGYWQFIKETGQRYNLTINNSVDERYDFDLSTRAAAAYLKDLYDEFEDWELAMAAYNTGEGNVRKFLKGRNVDFWTLHKEKRLAKETREYVPKIIAMKMIASKPWEYGFQDISYFEPLKFLAVKINNPITFKYLSNRFKISTQELKELNPKYKTDNIVLNKKETIIRMPAGIKI